MKLTVLHDGMMGDCFLSTYWSLGGHVKAGAFLSSKQRCALKAFNGGSPVCIVTGLVHDVYYLIIGSWTCASLFNVSYRL